MARQAGFRGSSSIAGAALVGLGAFILYENLAEAIARLSHFLGANSCDGLGILPAVVLAASRLVQSYAAGHQRFLHGFLQQMLIACWPLLLVMVGTVLSRDGFTDDVTAVCRKDDRDVDQTGAGSTFD